MLGHHLWPPIRTLMRLSKQLWTRLLHAGHSTLGRPPLARWTNVKRRKHRPGVRAPCLSILLPSFWIMWSSSIGYLVIWCSMIGFCAFTYLYIYMHIQPSCVDSAPLIYICWHILYIYIYIFHHGVGRHRLRRKSPPSRRLLALSPFWVIQRLHLAPMGFVQQIFLGHLMAPLLLLIMVNPRAENPKVQ